MIHQERVVLVGGPLMTLREEEYEEEEKRRKDHFKATKQGAPLHLVIRVITTELGNTPPDIHYTSD